MPECWRMAQLTQEIVKAAIEGLEGPQAAHRLPNRGTTRDADEWNWHTVQNGCSTLNQSRQFDQKEKTDKRSRAGSDRGSTTQAMGGKKAGAEKLLVNRLKEANRR